MNLFIPWISLYKLSSNADGRILSDEDDKNS